MTRPSWHARALAALSAYTAPGLFSAGTLPYIICDHERPDIVALRPPGRFIDAKDSRAWQPYFVARDAWKIENPGQSDSNMRRLCGRLVEEGVLELEQEVRGWYVQNFYRKKASQ